MWRGHGRKHKWENITLRTIFLCEEKLKLKEILAFPYWPR